MVFGGIPNPIDKVKEGLDKAKDVLEDLNPFAFLKHLATLGDFIKKVLQLITDPKKFLALLLAWVFGFAIWVVVFLLYSIWNIWPLREVPFFLFYFVTVILVELIISLVMFAIFLIFCAIAIIMWILDLATFGLVRWLTRCENHVDAWFKQANFAYGNVAKRMVFAQLPCASRFKPNGFWCVRQPSYDPDFCPQQQIFRIYKGLGVSSPWILDKINEDTAFKLSTPAKKEEALKKFFQTRQAFLNQCGGALHPYKHMIRCVCANYDKIKLENESDRELLPPLCKQVFCEAGDKESFCAKFPEEDINADKANLEDIVRKLTRYMVLVVFGTIFLLILVYNRGWGGASGDETSLFETVTGVFK